MHYIYRYIDELMNEMKFATINNTKMVHLNRMLYTLFFSTKSLWKCNKFPFSFVFQNENFPLFFPPFLFFLFLSSL